MEFVIFWKFYFNFLRIIRTKLGITKGTNSISSMGLAAISECNQKDRRMENIPGNVAYIPNLSTMNFTPNFS